MRKDVVEIVVALTEGHQRQHPVVAGRVLLGIGTRAPYVRQGVDEEREVVAEDQTGQHPVSSNAPQMSPSAQPTSAGIPKLAAWVSSA